MQHVNFYPWRGAKYDTGINNKRILILGESHYCEDSDKSQKSRHRCPKEFDNYCMSCYMDRECHEKTIDTIVDHPCCPYGRSRKLGQIIREFIFQTGQAGE